MPRIVIPDDEPPVLARSNAWGSLTAREAVGYYDTLPSSEEDLIARIRDAEVVINIRSSSRFTAAVFERCRQLRLISIWGTGTDNVDLQAAKSRGVAVTNTPAVSAVSIAEHTLALMLAVARRLPTLDVETRQGYWPRGQSVQLHGKTLGIVGLGAIGRQVATIAAGIGMRVIAWTMHPNPELGFELVPLEQLLRTSDVVSIHLRLSDQTRGLIGERELGMMKPTSILINTARGAIVDEDALADALANHRMAGAGLDVYATEPLPKNHPLTWVANAVLTPHCAGITAEALEAGMQMAVDNVWNFLDGKPTHIVVPGK